MLGYGGAKGSFRVPPPLWPADLVRHVGQNGKTLASGRRRWQKIRFVWKNGKRAGANRKSGK